MIENPMILTAILLMALIVYITRISGYLMGLQIRHIPGIKPVLETLPGCAFMAILAPAVRQGNLTEIIAFLAVVILMWKTDNVALATITGVLILLFAEPYMPSLLS